MKIIEPHLCNSELLLDLTYAETFSNLDERFVRAISKLLAADFVSLFIGEWLEDATPRLLATFVSGKLGKISPQSICLPEPEVVFPIHLTSGQLLSLSIDIEPSISKITEVVQLIAVYVNQNAHLVRSNKDGLTTLKNRRSFDLEYTQLAGNQKFEDSNVIAVLDIDHFKQVNDRFGHVIGDETLVSIANLMKQFFERDDFLYRIGGEEFIILLKDKQLAEAEALLEKLRVKIEQHEFAQIGQLTVSQGFVLLTHNCDSTLLFEQADAALYFAKKNGRNCIKNYQVLVENGDIEPVLDRTGDIELF